MGVVNINPASQKGPYLRQGGWYGPGQSFEADVEVTAFEAQVEPGNGPGYDRDCEKSQYCQFTIKIVEPDQVVYIYHHEPTDANTRSKALKFIAQLGIEIDEKGNFEVDDDGAPIVGTKCALNVLEPRPDKNDETVFYTGRLVDLAAV